MRRLIATLQRIDRALARLRIAIALRRDRHLRYDWRRAWRAAGRMA